MTLLQSLVSVCAFAMVPLQTHAALAPQAEEAVAMDLSGNPVQAQLPYLGQEKLRSTDHQARTAPPRTRMNGREDHTEHRVCRGCGRPQLWHRFRGATPAHRPPAARRRRMPAPASGRASRATTSPWQLRTAARCTCTTRYCPTALPLVPRASRASRAQETAGGGDGGQLGFGLPRA